MTYGPDNRLPYRRGVADPRVSRSWLGMALLNLMVRL